MRKLFQGPPPFLLPEIRFPDDLVILVLAPHPDDFDEIGVTMRFFSHNGNPIHVAVVSSGAGGVEDRFCNPATYSRKRAIRQQEQRASCSFFGLHEAHLTFLQLDEDPQGHPAESPENFGRIRNHFLRIRPALVFLPHGNDTNRCHHMTYTFFRKIAARAGHPLAAFYNRDPKTVSMRHSIYMPFGPEEAAWKSALLRHHQSQQQRNLNSRQQGFDQRILTMNRCCARTCPAPAPYAEVFELEFWE